MRAVVIKPSADRQSALPGLRIELRDIEAEARGVVVAAHTEALRIVTEARQRTSAELMAAQAARATAVQDGRREGVELGRAEGLEVGRKQGLAESREKFEKSAEPLLTAMKNLVGEFAARREQLFEESAQDVLVVALAIAKRMSGSAARIDPQTACQSARTALETVRGGNRVTLRVNPSDLELVQAYCPSLASMIAGREMEIQGDALVGAGGAMVESASGMADARLETQFAVIADELIENWRERLAEVSGASEASRGGDGSR